MQPTECDKSAYRWRPPSLAGQPGHELRMLNSFTKKKELFVAQQSNTIRWYTCGPTVYDVSHLGHARCYITFDIIRRILADYFGFHVFYVMNITDIDDKIIKRARSSHLCQQYIQKCLTSPVAKEELLAQLKLALQNYETRRADETDPDKLVLIKSTLAASKEAIARFDAPSTADSSPSQLLDSLRDIIADEEDAKFGSTITDHHIFKSLTTKFEQEFHDDMQKLNVMPPSALTRVSEYFDEIGLYLKKLEANGYAYRASDGSVYFDTNKFDASPKHSYAKLVREAFGHKKCLDEGEGELTTACQTQTDLKRSANDFALWKKSKPGEPSWTTQDYAPGRPGWHIECSVMACDLLGESFDIHSGGTDLKFPHHDNEIAQAEAYYDTGKDWVNYFIHSGHLTISGCKMSKSLKNFITIRQALQDYTSRQLRFAFLAHGWAETLDYSTNTMNTALAYEKTFREFFLNVLDTLRRHQSKIGQSSEEKAKLCHFFKKWSAEDKLLNQEFIDTTIKVDLALCDNFDTRTVLNALSGLVRECNKRPDVDSILLRDVACYVAKLLHLFGTTFHEFKLEGVFSREAGQEQAGGASDGDKTETILKYVGLLAQFRADIRQMAKVGGDSQQSVKEILALCDNIRDETLPKLGVRLEDREVDGAPYVVKLVDPETLAKERALAEKLELERKMKKEAARLEKLRLEQLREEKMKIPPQEIFRSQTDKYSLFDSRGMPTHDAEGKELSKSALKKLEKQYAEQEAKYNKYIAGGQA